MTRIPTPEEIVSAHRRLLRIAVEALRLGTVHAQEYADWKDEPIDRALAPALVRKGAKRYLIQQQQPVTDEEAADELDWDPEFLSNLGLALTAPGIQIRILRSAPGDMLPVPGHSEARRLYYTQPGLFDVLHGEDHAAELPPLVRLILHWGTDEDYNLERVWLGCPESGGETRESVRSHWDEPIWRRHSLISDGQVQAEVTDLDIRLDSEATGSTG